jgi:cysteine desulfurase
MVYLDYAANSPVDEEVLDLFYDITKRYYANPNSVHKLGLETKKMIDDATSNIAKNLKIDSNEIIYTSGASESNNLAVKGICERYKSNGKHIIVSTLEHNSIIAPAAAMQEIGFDVDVLPVLANGLVNIDELKKLIREDTILVSVCSVDSEIGIRQPIEEIAKVVKEYPNCHFHTDASQALGKVNIDFSDVDLITITPHKFFGMTGTGLLIKKKNVQLKPIINGGKSTTVYRAGTPELANIIALDKALDKALKHQEERLGYIKSLQKSLIEGLKKYPLVHINNTENSIPSTINISVKGVRSLDLAKRLEESDIYVSTKTSCCPSESPSKLVYALTKDKSLASSSLRISLAHLTKKEEIEYFLDEFDKAYKELTNGKV